MSKARSLNIRKDDTKRLDEDARVMEAKLEMLRRTMDVAEGSARNTSDGCRWRSGTTSKPIRGNYVKGVLEAPLKTSSRQKGVALTATNGSGRNTPLAGVGGGGGTPTNTPPQESTFVDMFGNGKSTLTSVPAAQQDLAPINGGNTSKAAANLQQAVSQQSQEAMEVETFLSELKLDRYIGLFMEHGFDCMDVVLDMRESHMRDIGMAAGHIIKLQKKLGEIAPASVCASHTSVSGNTSAETAQRRVSFGAMETLPAPKQEAAPVGGGPSLLDGHYDEAEAAASFQDALRAWRTGGKEAAGSHSQTCATNEPAVKASPGAFWSSLGGGEMDLARVSTPDRTPKEIIEGKAERETQGGSAPSDEKVCCYQCYRQFYTKFSVERRVTPGIGAEGCGSCDTKQFCSEVCAQKWDVAMEAKAEALRKRQEKLSKFEHLQQALNAEVCAA